MDNLDDEQWMVLRAVLDRMVPADDFPAACANGVDRYLTQQFAGDLAPLLPFYRAGLAALAAESLAAHETPFAALDAAAQDAVLHAIERGAVRTSWDVEPRRFVALIAQHAIEGYYSDAGNGGNATGASWRMLGFVVTA